MWRPCIKFRRSLLRIKTFSEKAGLDRKILGVKAICEVVPKELGHKERLRLVNDVRPGPLQK